MLSTNRAPIHSDSIETALLAANVRRLRAELNWSTRSFSEHTGINRSFLTRLEHGRHATVTIVTLERIAKGFGVHPAMLISSSPRKIKLEEVLPLRQVVAGSVAYWRKNLNWTQQELSQLAAVNRSLLAEVERVNGRNVTLDVLVRLAKALNVPVEELLTNPAQNPSGDALEQFSYSARRS